jgi:hypothetical protein
MGRPEHYELTLDKLFVSSLKKVYVKKEGLDRDVVECRHVDYQLFVYVPRLAGGVVSALQRYVALGDAPR